VERKNKSIERMPPTTTTFESEKRKALKKKKAYELVCIRYVWAGRVKNSGSPL